MNTPRKFIRLPAVLATTGMARSTIYKAIDEGSFPPQISIGPRSVAWLEADIQAWLDERITRSRDPTFHEKHSPASSIRRRIGCQR